MICPGGGTESLARSAKDAVEPPGQRARSFLFAHLGFLGAHALPRELQDQRVMHEPASQRNSRRVRQQKLDGAADRVFRSNFERSVRFISASLDGGKLWAGRCKPASVICLPSLQLHPFGVRRSEGERSEPSAAEPKRGEAAPHAQNWSRAGHVGSLLGCRQTHPTSKTTWPTTPILNS